MYLLKQYFFRPIPKNIMCNFSFWLNANFLKVEFSMARSCIFFCSNSNSYSGTISNNLWTLTQTFNLRCMNNHHWSLRQRAHVRVAGSWKVWNTLIPAMSLFQLMHQDAAAPSDLTNSFSSFNLLLESIATSYLSSNPNLSLFTTKPINIFPTSEHVLKREQEEKPRV